MEPPSALLLVGILPLSICTIIQGFLIPYNPNVHTWENVAEKGLVQGLKWLYKNRVQSCTSYAAYLAAREGHYEAVQYLQRFIDITPEIVLAPVLSGHLTLCSYLLGSKTISYKFVNMIEKTSIVTLEVADTKDWFLSREGPVTFLAFETVHWLDPYFVLFRDPTILVSKDGVRWRKIFSVPRFELVISQIQVFKAEEIFLVIYRERVFLTDGTRSLEITEIVRCSTP